MKFKMIFILKYIIIFFVLPITTPRIGAVIEMREK
jgi:hypothetical protein